MRSEQEMLSLIVDTAAHDDRVRAVIMNGSRANPKAPRDPFQDFDIVYVVTDVDSFKRDPLWIRRFGELMIIQIPEDMGDPPPMNNGTCVFLMQFTDGNRIDLTIFPVAGLSELERDSLSVLLLDKDRIIESFPPPSDIDYLPRPPTAKQFADCCNEFWWVCPYVAKGLWRGEIIYAKHFLDVVVREQTMNMLSWYVGTRTNFNVSPGKLGKYLGGCLEADLWALLQNTYSGSDCDETWESLLAMCVLFRMTAAAVGMHFAYEYPHDDDARVSAHLLHVRALPTNAGEIY